MNHFHNCFTEYKDEKVQKLIHWLQTKSYREESGKRPYVRTWLTSLCGPFLRVLGKEKGNERFNVPDELSC